MGQTKMKPEDLTVEAVEKAIDIPSGRWINQCYGIALAIVDAGLVEGRAVYGMYFGPVDKDSYFDHDRPCHRHGWVKLKDGRVLDPTRWVFENVPAYIFHGVVGREYDEGAQLFRAAYRKPCPTPDDPLWREGDERYLYLSSDCISHLKAMSDNQGEREDSIYKVPMAVLFWLVNLSVAELEPHVKEFYSAVANTGLKPMIPIDNWSQVME